jgi:hypothetical protein
MRGDIVVVMRVAVAIRLGGGSARGTWGCYGLEGWWWINLVSERFADESYKGGGWC